MDEWTLGLYEAFDTKAISTRLGAPKNLIRLPASQINMGQKIGTYQKCGARKSKWRRVGVADTLLSKSVYDPETILHQAAS